MKALSNLKVLDFTTLLPGPYATMMLADLGAEVLKISSPSKPDLILDHEPFAAGTDIAINELWLGRNKKNIFLNLKHPESIKIIKELVKEYDIVIEQFRPGVMNKLGLGYEELKKENPGLIYCSLTGYGQTGPRAKPYSTSWASPLQYQTRSSSYCPHSTCPWAGAYGICSHGRW